MFILNGTCLTILHSFQSLLQLAKERTSEFDELSHVYSIVSSTLNDTDRISLDEKLALLKEKYHRLSDNLTQRLTLLDEATRTYLSFSNSFLYSFIQVNAMISMLNMNESKKFINNYKLISLNSNSTLPSMMILSPMKDV